MSVTGGSVGEGTRYRVGNSPEATVGLASCGVGKASPEAGQLVADRGQSGSSGSVNVLVSIRTTWGTVGIRQRHAQSGRRGSIFAANVSAAGPAAVISWELPSLCTIFTVNVDRRCRSHTETDPASTVSAPPLARPMLNASVGPPIWPSVS